jgi:PTS system glucose-specific IIA component
MGLFSREKSTALLAPVSGSLLSLDKVADPVFADGTMGSGIAIVPDGNEVVSPCRGTVTYVPDTKHAVALTDEHGIEILIHVGLDTVNLKGEGFTARVHAGDAVAPGQVLISFDQGLIHKKGYDLTTPIIVTGGGVVETVSRQGGTVVCAGRDTVLKVTYNK